MIIAIFHIQFQQHCYISYSISILLFNIFKPNISRIQTIVWLCNLLLLSFKTFFTFCMISDSVSKKFGTRKSILLVSKKFDMEKSIGFSIGKKLVSEKVSDSVLFRFVTHWLKNVTWLTRGAVRPFRCLDVFVF